MQMLHFGQITAFLFRGQNFAKSVENEAYFHFSKSKSTNLKKKLAYCPIYK